MEVIYTRYSRERHPQFQIKTTIYDDGTKIRVKKESLDKTNNRHILDIFNNFQLLRNYYIKDCLLPPLYSNGALIFDYLEDESLERVMLKAILNKDSNKLFDYLSEYKSFLHQVAGSNYRDFENSKEFISFFGNKYPFENLKSFLISNIDLNFDNIFHSEKGLIILDYEWVLSFPVPLDFIIFRAVNTFYYNHYYLLKDFVSITTILNFFEVHEANLEYFIEMAEVFASYTGTYQAKSVLNNYSKKNVTFNFEEPEELTAQIFYREREEDFAEERSIKQSVDSNVQELKFFIEHKACFYRFDPLDNYCIVQLKKVSVIDREGKENILNEFITNSDIHIGETYYFFTNDPQIYFTSEVEPVSINILIEYLDLDLQSFRQLSEYYSGLMKIKELENSELKGTVETMLEEVNSQTAILEGQLLKHKDHINSLQNDIQELDLKNAKLVAETQSLIVSLNEKDLIIERVQQMLWWKITKYLEKIFKRID